MSTTITTRVTPSPVKNADSAAAMISAPAPKVQIWKKSVSRAARPASCPASRKIHGASGISGQKQRDAVEPHPRPLPDGRPDPLRLARPVILGHERVDVRGHAQRKADQGEMDHAGRHGRGHRLLGVPEQEHPVDEVHHRPGGRRDDQRDRQPQHVPPAAGTGPPACRFASSRLVFHHFTLRRLAGGRAEGLSAAATLATRRRQSCHRRRRSTVAVPRSHGGPPPACFRQQLDAEMPHAPLSQARHGLGEILGVGVEDRVAALAVGQHGMLDAQPVAQPQLVPPAGPAAVASGRCLARASGRTGNTPRGTCGVWRWTTTSSHSGGTAAARSSNCRRLRS